MKKLLAIITCICIFTISIPVNAFASGGYVDGKYLTQEEIDKLYNNKIDETDSYDIYMRNIKTNNDSKSTAPDSTSIKRNPGDTGKLIVKKIENNKSTNRKNVTQNKNTEKKDADKLPKTGDGTGTYMTAYQLGSIGIMMLFLAGLLTLLYRRKNNYKA